MKPTSAAPLRGLAGFVALSRLKFLAGGFVSFGAGAAIAAYRGFPIDATHYLIGQWTVTSFHLMVHYSNDFFDRASDARTTRTPFSGGSGVLVDGTLGPQVAMTAALICAASGFAGVATLVDHGRIVAACIAVAIAAGAWTYSSPPARLLARGWGEADTALVVAVLVALCGYATFANAVDGGVVLSLMPGAFAMAIMMLCVEYPDFEADAATGKRNLVVRLGRSAARYLVYVLAAALYASVLVACAFGAPWTLAAFALPSAYFVFGLVRMLERGEFGMLAQDARIAKAGVATFLATMLAELFAYASLLR